MPASGRQNLIRIETYRQIQPKEGTKIPLLMSLNATCPHVKGEKTFSTLLNCNLSLTQYIKQIMRIKGLMLIKHSIVFITKIYFELSWKLQGRSPPNKE